MTRHLDELKARGFTNFHTLLFAKDVSAARQPKRLAVAVAVLLFLTATSAQAMVGLSAVPWVGGCSVALVGSSIAVVLGKASPLGKLLALLLIGMGAAAVWGLSRAPEYSTYETWINAASAFCTAVSIYASRLALRLSRT